MWGALGSVDDYYRAFFVREGGDFLYRVFSAYDVRDLRYRNDFRFIGDEFFDFVKVDAAVLFAVDVSERRASFAFYNTCEEADKLINSIKTIRERMGYGK